MKNYARNAAVSLFAGAALTGAAIAPAHAQPVVTGGLVNVTIVDAVDVTLRDVDVALVAALNIAANVCDTTVNVLAADFSNDGEATCTNEDTGDSVTISQI